MTEAPKLTLERPRLERVLVTARDQVTGKSKSITIYGTTPEQLIELLKREASDGEASEKPKSASARR